MKDRKHASQKECKMWIFTDDPQLKEILPHFLCPLELAAFEKDFLLTGYRIGNKLIKLTSGTNRALLFTARQRVKFFYDIVRTAMIAEAIDRDPLKKKFLLSRPEQFSELHESLINKLKRNNIATMEELGLIGRANIVGYKNMGKTSADQLVILFEKYGCGDLI